MDIIDMTLCELSAALKTKKVSSLEATKACLKRIEQTKELNNFITVCEDEAIEAAKRADEAIASNGEYSPLLGVPVAVKDNIVTKNVRTTCASKILENFVPPYDATVVKKLKSAGAVLIGKTNMDEFAMGSTNEFSAFGAAHNAVDFTRVAGGSSGGSASAVAAKQAFGALGSDTGGSIRQPAAYNGAVGFKPTYSAVSRYGLVAFASSLDQIGPITRSVDDALELSKVIFGKDIHDSTSADVLLPDKLSGEVKGRVIGVADEFLNGLGEKETAAFNGAVKALEKMGAVVKRVSISSFNAALAVYYVLSSAEASSNLARFDGVKYGRRAESYTDISDLYERTRTEFLGDEVKRRIMIGNYVLSSGYYDAYYIKASKARTVIKREYDEALSKCDALLCPTAPSAAPKIGEETDPAKAYLSDIYTVPVNIAGLPAVSVPFGSDGKMPLGVQVIAKACSDGVVLDIAKALERARG
ncbi:MAG: Asp-tRNA(Asn)/Glu-tRNA(Gln) amidotransferase subunit GatA [Clostridiales bacterium]|nr:Asp-tRNA(Asn)/Glu-tRNA(Gln) amidotransferase subunit GatA [Clostridiales bacterium]